MMGPEPLGLDLSLLHMIIAPHPQGTCRNNILVINDITLNQLASREFMDALGTGLGCLSEPKILKNSDELRVYLSFLWLC